MSHRFHHCRLFARSELSAVVLILTGCAHEAWLGKQCPDSEVSCDATGWAAGSGVFDAGRSTGQPADAAMETAETAAADAEPSAPNGLPDAQAAVTPDAASPDAAANCRQVMMSFFACASTVEMSGIPQLLAGRAYTLRFRGAYTLSTTFQVQGSTSACAAMMLGTVTLTAGAPAVERCLRPSEDIALLVSFMSGDVQVWNQDGLLAEVCDGCE